MITRGLWLPRSPRRLIGAQVEQEHKCATNHRPSCTTARGFRLPQRGQQPVVSTGPCRPPNTRPPLTSRCRAPRNLCRKSIGGAPAYGKVGMRRDCVTAADEPEIRVARDAVGQEGGAWHSISPIALNKRPNKLHASRPISCHHPTRCVRAEPTEAEGQSLMLYQSPGSPRGVQRKQMSRYIHQPPANLARRWPGSPSCSWSL